MADEVEGEEVDGTNTEKAENSENDILANALKSASQKSLVEADDLNVPEDQ